MALSTFQHKCGSKRKNHQCGLGLCSTETVDQHCRKCTDCFGPIKGHPKPSGKLCTLEPVLSEMEKTEAKMQEQQKRLERDRQRMSTPENKAATRKRMASTDNKEATKKRLASTENKEATKKRLASPQNKEADRERKAAKIKFESRSERKIRLENKRKSEKLARQRKKKAFGYEAWCDPMDRDKPKIGPLDLPLYDHGVL
jgi:hypothetical protein